MGSFGDCSILGTLSLSPTFEQSPPSVADAPERGGDLAAVGATF